MPVSPYPTLPPSGEQHVIGHGRHAAVITEIGATLRSYTVGDVNVIDGFDASEMCGGGRGQVLAPWPNRLGQGRYIFDGRHAQAAWDEPARRNAIHGLVRWMPWRLESRAQNVVTLGCRLHPQPAYPWAVQLFIEYRLGRDGLSVTARVTNLDDVPAPIGLGFHPYVTVGTPTIDTTRIQVPAQRRLITDDRGLPVEETAVSRTEYDFTASRPVGTTRLDTAYTELWRDDDGVARVELDNSEGTRGVTLWMDERFNYIMIFTGDTLDPQQRRRSIAIEPMTCPPDALRSGTDIVRLEPAETWRARWGITPR